MMHILHILHISYIVHIIHMLHIIHILHILHIMHVDYFTLFSRYLQKAPVVFPYTNSLGNIMETEKNHSLKHAPNDIVNNVKWADSINMSCEAPETGHKDWVKKQGGKTNQGPAVTLCMVQHSRAYGSKRIHVLLCEAVQGAFLINCAYFTYFETYAYVTYFAYHTYYAYFAYFIY